MILFETVLPIMLAFFIVTVSPGPANIAVATVAMRKGRRAGQSFGLGLSIGLAFWGIVAATGMGAILQSSVHALMLLKILGGVYLIWLAIQAARSVAYPTEIPQAEMRQGNWFLQGLALNLSNPKAVVAWMAALSMGLDANGSNALVITATGMCILIGFANYAGYAAAFSLPGVMKTYRRISRWVEGTVAILFAAAGLGLLRSAIMR